MQQDNIEIQDTIKANPSDQPSGERKKYTVKAENGLFKNGKLYKVGSEIDLDENTAKRFIEIDEVE